MGIPSAAVRAAPAHTARTITLITGDRVTLTGAPGSISVHVEHGPGRSQIGITTLRSGDDVTVIPDDVAQWKVPGLRGADRLGVSLREQREQAMLYQTLATLRCDCPIVCDTQRWLRRS